MSEARIICDSHGHREGQAGECPACVDLLVSNFKVNTAALLAAEQENERLREMANRDRALAGLTQALSAKVLEENERLRIELAVCRGLADGYGGDFSGTDAGIKFAVIASRADAALAPQPTPERSKGSE